jgi:bacillithiol biosynthesis cysteine-adding enzyme BshC
LFTGPLFFIYKILTVINFCEELNKKNADKNFVPVYWMASEDHDFEEVNHAYLFGKKLAWQSEQKGKVGDFKLNEIAPALEELKTILRTSDRAVELYTKIESFYKTDNLAKATRLFVNELFGAYGLVILDADNKELKKQFITEFKKDIFENTAIKTVSETNNYLTENGYSVQVNPREINVFYTDTNLRERIELRGDKYCVNNTSIELSKTELEQKLESETEIFSPNVILRPMYQQKIMPNIAYVGGPGEIVYWLQYKKMFEVFALPYPLLQPRNFTMVIDKGSQGKLQKLNFEFLDLFESIETLTKKLISSEAEEIELSAEKNELNTLFEKIKTTAGQIDKTLEGTVAAELQKTLKGIEMIEQKIIRSIKAKNETAINQIKTIKNKFFPENNIQERHDNFLPFYLNNKDFIEEVKTAFAKNEVSNLAYLLLLEE